MSDEHVIKQGRWIQAYWRDSLQPLGVKFIAENMDDAESTVAQMCAALDIPREAVMFAKPDGW